MKNYPFPLFTGIHTAIATVLALSSAAQGQALYWDTNGTAAAFGDFGGSWNGAATNFNSDATGGAGGALSAVTSSANSVTISGAGATGVILVTGNQTVGSIDFANTGNLAALQIGDKNGAARSLTVTGAITDSGAGNSDIRVINLTSSAAATVLVASSITTGVLSFAEELFGNAQFFSTGYDITLATQFTLGRGNGNFTYTQTGGNVTVNDTTRGINFNAGDLTNAASSTRAHTYNLNGGELRVGRIGVNTPNEGNNNTANAYSSNARLEFNSGTIRNNVVNGSLLFQNGIAFKDYNGSGTKDMQYNTHLPLTVALSQTGTHTINADGASSSIIVTPGAQFVNKTSEAGTLTKSGLGTLVFTGGGPVAVNSYTGSTTVTAGTVSTDYNRIAGQAATAGINSLNNGYSAGSQLILDGGNYSLVGRGSAIAGSATGVTLNAGVAGMQVNVGSTANLVIGQSVTNANLPAGTYIRQIVNGTTIELNALSTNVANQASQTLTFGAGTFNNTQTINDVSLLKNATVTVTPGAGTSTTLLSFGNLTGAGGLTKAGTGTLKLTGSVSYTGPTAISAGTLEFASSGNQTITAPVTGSGTLVKSGAGTLTLDSIPANGRHEFAGAVIVDGGTLANAGGAEGLYKAASFTVNNGGILLVNSDSLGFGAASPITINGGGTVRGGVQGIGSLTLNGGLLDGTGSFLGVNFALSQNVTVGGSSASTIQGNAGIALNGYEAAAGATRTFDVANATGDANADLTISTVIRNAYGPSNNLANLQKSGAGTMVLSGANVYTGTTTVSAGTLAINGNQNAATGAVSVAAGATNATAVRLKGVGTVGGNTSFAADPDAAGAQVGGIHSPGNSVGKQTFDASGAPTTNLTYNSGSIFEWELAATPAATTITDNVNYASNRGIAYDAVNVTGTLGGSDAIFRVVLDGNQTFADAFWSTNRTWSDIFRTGDGTGTSNVSYASIFSSFQYYNNSGAGATLNALATPTTYGSFSITGSSLTWSAVPEPTSALAGLLVTAGLLRRRRNA